MAKRVRYNGGTESYYGCSDPAKLVVGKEYEVVHSNVRAWQTDYTLKGVEGSFNSVWFDEVSSNNVYIAISNEVPEIGKRYTCSKIEFVKGLPNLVPACTSTVEGVEHMGNHVYHVITHNSVYIVKVG